MAQYSSKDVGFILVDGYSLLGTVTTVQDNVEAILQETTVLGDSWVKFASAGIRKGALTQNGFYNDAAGSANAALVGSTGAARVFTYCLEGNVIGRTFVGFSGPIQAKYERTAQLEKLHTANAVYTPSGPIEEGQVLHAHTAETAASGDTRLSSVDNTTVRQPVMVIVSNTAVAATVVTTSGPHGLANTDKVFISGSNCTPTIDGERIVTVTGPTTFTVPVTVTIAGTAGSYVRCNTTNGGSAYVECSALVLGGYTNVALKVQHSLDNSAWVDLATFTVITAAPAAQRVVVASGTLVNRYLDATWAFTGAGSGMSVTFMTGFSRA